MTQYPQQCTANVTDTWNSYRCTKTARPGTSMCATHSPDAAAKRAAKAAERTAEYNRYWKLYGLRNDIMKELVQVGPGTLPPVLRELVDQWERIRAEGPARLDKHTSI